MELDIPRIAIAPVLHSLEKARVIVATENEQFLPGRDLDAIRLSDILQAVRTVPTGRLTVGIRPIGPAIAVVDQLETSVREAMDKRSLKQLVEDK